MSEPLEDLAAVTDAVFRHRLSGLQALTAQEAMLRQQLARLDEARLAGIAEASGDIGMRALGADLLWQGWVMRQRTQLNMRLANVLVMKEAQGRALRAAFGKARVAEELCAQQKAVAKADREKRLNRD